MQRVIDVLAGYREIADELGAARSVAVATSAVRDADNGPEFRERGPDRARVRARDHHRRRGGAPDLPGRHRRARRRRAHAGDRHRRRQHRVRDRAAGAGAGLPRVHPAGVGAPVRAPPGLRPARARTRPRRWAGPRARSSPRACPGGRARAGRRARIAVAGTATSLAAIDQELVPYDPDRVDGYRLGAGRLRADAGAAGVHAAGRAARGAGPAPRPRADHRGRRGDPGRGAARPSACARPRYAKPTSSTASRWTLCTKGSKA